MSKASRVSNHMAYAKKTIYKLSCKVPIYVCEIVLCVCGFVSVCAHVVHVLHIIILLCERIIHILALQPKL